MPEGCSLPSFSCMAHERASRVLVLACPRARGNCGKPRFAHQPAAGIAWAKKRVGFLHTVLYFPLVKYSTVYTKFVKYGIFFRLIFMSIMQSLSVSSGKK
jgi:hypothetical protein